MEAGFSLIAPGRTKLRGLIKSIDCVRSMAGGGALISPSSVKLRRSNSGKSDKRFSSMYILSWIGRNEGFLLRVVVGTAKVGCGLEILRNLDRDRLREEILVMVDILETDFLTSLAGRCGGSGVKGKSS